MALVVPRPAVGWRVAAMAAVLLWPATWYVSAWWGQYESIYVLPVVLARAGGARAAGRAWWRRCWR